MFLVQGVASWLHTYHNVNDRRTAELPNVGKAMNAILHVTHRARPDLVPSITYDRTEWAIDLVLSAQRADAAAAEVDCGAKTDAEPERGRGRIAVLSSCPRRDALADPGLLCASRGRSRPRRTEDPAAAPLARH